ncbi:MAG: hypothetical protein GC185_08520 [Alphaproteobacteria bacterium]|nr:hypothetical protein [Alphaproteobacteria bacterium]
MTRAAALLLALCLFAAPARAEDAQRAAQATALHDAACTRLGDFYWEIGDTDGKLAAGQVGAKFSRTTRMRLDSASKIVFGAYALEKLGDKPLTAELINLFRMTAGYSHSSHGYFRCRPSNTVATCAKKVIGRGPYASDAGKFSYGGAHSMALGLALGLGEKDGKAMEAEYKKFLGDDTHFSFTSMVFAGGLTDSAADYAVFLRKILAGKLRLAAMLGADAVCAGQSGCPEGAVVNSPVPARWHYSLLHWVEDDKTGDGAFSSPGLEGFYPWISADKKYYGIVARQKFGLHAAQESVECGIAIRKAFMGAVSPSVSGPQGTTPPLP